MSEPTKQICITFDRFVEVLRGWDKNIEIQFHAKTSGWYAVPISTMALSLWESLKPNTKRTPTDLFLEGIADIQVRDFIAAYESPEVFEWCPLIQGNRDMGHPKRVFEELNKYAQETILSEGLLEKAIASYKRLLEKRRELRAQQKAKKKVDKKGKPITGEAKIGHGTRRRVYKKDRYECVYCGVRVIPDYEIAKAEKEIMPDTGTIDHMIPGNHDFTNLVTACRSCNTAKSNRTPEEAGMIPQFGRFSEEAYQSVKED